MHIKFPERDFRDRETLENGDVAVNGDAATEEEPSKPRKEDLILITGKQEDCDKAREALLALVPVTEEVCALSALNAECSRIYKSTALMQCLFRVLHRCAGTPSLIA